MNLSESQQPLYNEEKRPTMLSETDSFPWVLRNWVPKTSSSDILHIEARFHTTGWSGKSIEMGFFTLTFSTHHELQ